MIYVIEGYWKDDKSEFEGLVTDFDCTPEGFDDDDLFFYGLNKSDIEEAIELKNDTAHDFVITNYYDL